MRDGTAEPVSRDQIIRRKSGGKIKTISYGAGNSKFLKTEIGWISDFGRTSASQQKIILWDSGN